MIKSVLICLLLLVSLNPALAQDAGSTASQDVTDTPADGSVPQDPSKLQKPLGRVKNTLEPNTESSSFVAEPDSLDPLNPRKDSIKEDEEPVLEDIKQVLNAPPPPAPEVSADATQAASGDQTKKEEPVAEVKKKEPEKKKKKPGRVPDEPDYVLEKKFNNIYKRYNINPTSEDVWAEASSKQTIQKYIVQKGDTLWSISSILFGDPNFWPKLWALNKQGILNPHFIKPGTEIHIYAGDEENSPTLTVGAADSGASSGSAASAGKSPISAANGKVTKIPPSLPLSRNENYFVHKDREVTIDLGTTPIFPPVYVSDIVITDAALQTEVKIQISEVAKFRCYEGRLIKSIRYVGQLKPEYDVYEPLDNFPSVTGDMHAYRLYGSAHPYDGKYLKLNQCKGLIASNLVLLPKGDIQKFRSQKISPSPSPKVIGGPDVTSQRLFLINQVAYVDFGSQPYEPGQIYKIRSQVTDSVTGQIKVLEKYGSFAVTVITEQEDVVEIGDAVISASN